MNSDPKFGFRFGEWQAYPLRNLLVGPSGDIHIEPKVMQVLEQLAANAGEVVERDHLLETLWGGRAMSDEPLTRCIATLRRVLDDSAKEPRFIQTIPKRGYRLVCDVEITTSDSASSPGKSASDSIRRGLVAAGIATLVAAGVIVGWQFFSDDTPRLTVDGAVRSEVSPYSIAVLPFANLGPDPDSDYLSDGLADELSNQLTKVSGVRVAARTSAFAFKGKNEDITDIARQLRVAYVLTGSVRRADNELRISAQLTEADGGFHVWSETWDRQFTDVFDIQDEIARAVTDALRVQLLNEVPATPRTNPEAYALYLKGREAYFARREPDADEAGPQLDEALALFTHSLALDPEFAPAWAQVAWTHFQRAQWMRENPSDVFALAEAAAERAISIDPDNVSALSALGAIYDLWHWDSETAANWYGKALAAAPRDPVLLNYFRLLYDRHEASEGSLAIAKAVYEYDPVNVSTLLNLALTYWTSGMRDEARQHLELARQMQPSADRVLVFDAFFAYMAGDFEEAARRTVTGHSVVRACSMHQLGADEEVQELLLDLRESQPPYALSLAEINACIGDHDRAFDWLQRAYDDRLPMLRNVRTNYFLANLRDDPRWDDLVARIGVGDGLLAPMRTFVDETTIVDSADVDLKD